LRDTYLYSVPALLLALLSPAGFRSSIAGMKYSPRAIWSRSVQAWIPPVRGIGSSRGMTLYSDRFHGKAW